MNYEQWNQAIISYFFEECNPGEIVFLQTDDETLSEIAQLSDFNIVNPADSLKQAVRHQFICDGNQVDLWNSVPKNFWRSPLNQEAPQVAFLALTVLAASRMNFTDSVSATNYYARLNELLFDSLIKGIPKGLDRQLFKVFWNYLCLWARDRHHVKLYLTEGASNRRYVWYPISQCLISENDRQRIYRFFSKHNLTPFSEPRDNELYTQLRYWTSSLQGSAKIGRYLANQYYKDSILSQVKSLLKHWDGEVPLDEAPSRRRRTTAPISVQLYFRHISNNVEVRLWFPRRGRDNTSCEVSPVSIQLLQTFDSEKWFKPVVDKKGAFWNLQNRLELKTNEIQPMTYTLAPSNIWVFQEDSERDDGWLSQRNMQLYEDHLIVFREKFAEHVLNCLKLTCALGDDKPNRIHNGWLYIRVKPVRLRVFSTRELWRLSVVPSQQIRLIGGLSVRDQHGHRAYLNICLPDVFVPNLGLSSEVPLKIDAHAYPVGENRLVKLENTLAPGVYQLSYGTQSRGTQRTLWVINPQRDMEYENQTLMANLSHDQMTVPKYSVERLAEISVKSDVWIAGARFFGTDISEATWDDVQTEVQVEEENNDSLPKSPAELISVVVKAAIEHKRNKSLMPEWLTQAISHLNQNIVLRALVEKKLRHYHKTALSYADLQQQAISHGSKTISSREA